MTLLAVGEISYDGVHVVNTKVLVYEFRLVRQTSGGIRATVLMYGF